MRWILNFVEGIDMPAETKPLLEIDRLNIGFDTNRGQLRPVRDVSYSIFPGQTLAVVGESGCGKSVTALSVLRLIPNPPGLITAGSVVFAGIEGSRPVLMEFQALVAPSAYGTPRRAVVGWDSGRLAMILAVLEARCGVGFGDRDVYLNVAGGLKVSEPAADLAAQPVHHAVNTVILVYES